MGRIAAALLGALALTAVTANAACPLRNTVPLKSLSAGFQAWKSVTAATAECGDILQQLKIAVPTTYDEVWAARIKEADVVAFPPGATMRVGWNLAVEFMNTCLGFGGALFD